MLPDTNSSTTNNSTIQIQGKNNNITKYQINNIILSLKRYEWLLKFINILIGVGSSGTGKNKKLNKKIKMNNSDDYITLQNIPFQDEYQIVSDMCLLLPKKIDSLNRM